MVLVVVVVVVAVVGLGVVTFPENQTEKCANMNTTILHIIYSVLGVSEHLDICDCRPFLQFVNKPCTPNKTLNENIDHQRRIKPLGSILQEHQTITKCSNSAIVMLKKPAMCQVSMMKAGRNRHRSCSKLTDNSRAA